MINGPPDFGASQTDIARSFLENVAKKMKKWVDKKRSHTEFKVGDLFLVKLLP